MPNALWRAVSGQKELPTNVEQALSIKLKRKKKPTARLPMIVVVVDEIDQLMSENQRVLRKLFAWADAPYSRMVSAEPFSSICSLIFAANAPLVPYMRQSTCPYSNVRRCSQQIRTVWLGHIPHSKIIV